MAGIQWAYTLARRVAIIMEDKDTLRVAAPFSSVLEEASSPPAALVPSVVVLEVVVVVVVVVVDAPASAICFGDWAGVAPESGVGSCLGSAAEVPSWPNTTPHHRATHSRATKQGRAIIIGILSRALLLPATPTHFLKLTD